MPIHHVEHIWGMPISIDIRDASGDVGRAVVEEVVEWFRVVDATWSTYREDSVITRFARGLIPVEALNDEIHAVLDRCEALTIDTNGAFDIHVPAPNGTVLEPSGFIKGWAVERAAEIVRTHKCASFCLNAGGDIAIGGNPQPGTKWRVGIRHPHDPGLVADVLELEGTWALATSAVYERGQHIIDPRTGRAADEILSVTVLGHDLSIVDAHATALFVLGLDGLDWILEHDGEAMMITKDGRCLATPGYDRHRLLPTASAS